MMAITWALFTYWLVSANFKLLIFKNQGSNLLHPLQHDSQDRVIFMPLTVAWAT